MKDTKNFKASEFACPCCGKNLMSQQFVDLLQTIRDKLNLPMKINSGFRCEKQNKKDGGAVNSAHLKGLAADIDCKKTNSGYRFLLVSLAMQAGIKRIGIKSGCVHLDIDTSLPNNQMWLY